MLLAGLLTKGMGGEAAVAAEAARNAAQNNKFVVCPERWGCTEQEKQQTIEDMAKGESALLRYLAANQGDEKARIAYEDYVRLRDDPNHIVYVYPYDKSIPYIPILDHTGAAIPNEKPIAGNEYSVYLFGNNKVAYDLSGSSKGVYYRYDNWFTVNAMDASGSKVRPPYIGLWHEIFHGIDDYRGTLGINGNNKNTSDPARFPNVAEEEAVWFENLIRGGTWGTPSKLRDRYH
jgi:hypothetical protein